MGIFDTFKILFMSDHDKAELARNRNATEDILTKLCKYGNTKVLEAAATNPNTPEEAIVEKLIEIVTDKNRNVRESAFEVVRKLRRKENLNLKLSLRLTQLLGHSDWIRSSEIVRALGILGSTISIDTICSLIHIAVKDGSVYQRPEYEIGEDGSIRPSTSYWVMKTDTDEGAVSVEAGYNRFILNAIRALGDIGDPHSLDDLKSIAKNKYIKQNEHLKGVANSILEKIQEGKKSTAHKKTQEKRDETQ